MTLAGSWFFGCSDSEIIHTELCVRFINAIIMSINSYAFCPCDDGTPNQSPGQVVEQLVVVS